MLNTLKFGVLSEKKIANKTWLIDLLSKVCWPLKRNARWSAIMHKRKGNYPGKSNITFLPMINLNQSVLLVALDSLCQVRGWSVSRRLCMPLQQ